jgi:hypothetical protein
LTAHSRLLSPLLQSSFQLLYRSSRDSPTASSFHSHVANQGSALLVIRVKVQGRDYVFGAYSENGFQTTANGQGQWFPSSPNGTWLFSLINAYKRNLKFKLKRGAEKYAQYGGDTRQTCSVSPDNDRQ